MTDFLVMNETVLAKHFEKVLQEHWSAGRKTVHGDNEGVYYRLPPDGKVKIYKKEYDLQKQKSPCL